MALLNKIKLLSRLPFSRKLQYISNLYFKLKARIIYRFTFEGFGVGSVIRSPLFLTHERIRIGNGVIIWDHARIEGISVHNQQFFSPLIDIADGVSIQQRSHITAATHLTIGKDTMISFDVTIQDSDHEYQDTVMPVSEQPLVIAKTSIGHSCFIGSGVKIQAGTTLGNHCVVGANAVVRGDFPDYCVIVGVPARIVKRYNEATQQWDKTDKNGVFL